MEPWIIWIIVAALLIIVEVLTQMVWTLCLAIGCAGAIAAYFFGADLTWQIVIMACLSVVAFIALMPKFKQWHERTEAKEGRNARTGMDALLGRKAIVVNEIKPGETGRARIDGDNWQVVAPHAGRTIHHGEEVRVIAYDSIILTVEPINNIIK